jgi:tRNA threonylcarbamoyladenosine biosynthesis protein TsaB
MNHLKGLSAMIADLLAEAGLSVRSLDCVAASQGPGSFTGIRIGVSTARALAQAAGIAAVGVPTLASFAYRLPSYRGAVCPVFDARRGQVYSGVFRLGEDGGPIVLLDGAARTPAELRRAIEGLDWDAQDESARELRFFGDGIEACGDTLSGLCTAFGAPFETSLAPLAARFQNASSVARLALYMRQNPSSAFASAATAAASREALLPVYLRKAEAERRLEEARNMQILQKP